MLPFLPIKKKSDGIATVYRAPDETQEPNQDDSGLHAAADDLLKAIHSHDSKLLIESLKAFFQIIDAMPHTEGEHENE